jgi:hypothetical protein
MPARAAVPASNGRTGAHPGLGASQSFQKETKCLTKSWQGKTRPS